MGVCLLGVQNFNAGFVKPKLQFFLYILLNVLIHAINVEKKFKT